MQKVIFLLLRSLPTQHPQALLQGNLPLLKQAMLRTLRMRVYTCGQGLFINMSQIYQVPKVFAASQGVSDIQAVRVFRDIQAVRVFRDIQAVRVLSDLQVA